MNRAFCLVVLLCQFALPSAAQVDTTKSPYGKYYFDGDDIVFRFDARAYAAAIRASDSVRVDFADLDILHVALSGNFNNWSLEGWKMKKIDKYTYQIRKPLKDLVGTPNWQFKFVINGSYWTPPDKVKQGVLSRYDLKNQEKKQQMPSDTGNVLFRLRGYTDRRKVILTGSFNNWDESALVMKRVGDGWQLRMSLKPGTYEYKFIADGEWMHDPANQERVSNQYGTFNSLMRVTKLVGFDLLGHLDAKQVILSGSFNGWSDRALRMQRTSTGWTLKIPLTGGKHQYKFIVDGNWMTDPVNKMTEVSWDGHTNSVIMVR